MAVLSSLCAHIGALWAFAKVNFLILPSDHLVERQADPPLPLAELAWLSIFQSIYANLLDLSLSNSNVSSNTLTSLLC